MIPYLVSKLAPNLSHLTKGLVKYVPGRSYFRAVPSKNGDKYVTSPPPQSLNWSVSQVCPDRVLLKDIMRRSIRLQFMYDSGRGIQFQDMGVKVAFRAIQR